MLNPKYFLLWLVTFSTLGWATELPLYQKIADNLPAKGTDQTVYMGDRMMLQRNGEYRECIVPKKNLTHKKRRMVFEFLANKPICKKDDQSHYFIDYTILEECRDIESDGNCSQFRNNAIKFIENSEDFELHIGIDQLTLRDLPTKFHKSYQLKKIDKSDISTNEYRFFNSTCSIQQTIEYMGKRKSEIKFFYSEFVSGLARDAFSREFQIDLEDGSTASYKGAVFEILSATNSDITYKVLRHFPNRTDSDAGLGEC